LLTSLKNNPNLSIVVPVYNEAGVIEDVIKNIYKKVVSKIPNTELIIAEDGSIDGTKQILKKLRSELSFTLVTTDARKGYTKAFKDALSIAKTELVFFSDSDGQHDPSDIFRLLEQINDADIVSGYKFPRRDPVHRIIISKGYNFLIYILFGLRTKDIDSGFKLIKRNVLDNVLKDVVRLKYCVMSEFMIKAHLSGYKIKEIPVNHYPRKSGKTSIFSPTKLPFIILGLIKSLFAIKIDSLKGTKK